MDRGLLLVFPLLDGDMIARVDPHYFTQCLLHFARSPKMTWRSLIVLKLSIVKYTTTDVTCDMHFVANNIL